jgi:hypothetical protein
VHRERSHESGVGEGGQRRKGWPHVFGESVVLVEHGLSWRDDRRVGGRFRHAGPGPGRRLRLGGRASVGRGDCDGRRGRNEGGVDTVVCVVAEDDDSLIQLCQHRGMRAMRGCGFCGMSDQEALAGFSEHSGIAALY